jgi:hypothetical protein
MGSKDRSGELSRTAAGKRTGRRSQGFLVSPDISGHLSNVIEVKAALREI